MGGFWGWECVAPQDADGEAADGFGGVLKPRKSSAAAARGEDEGEDEDEGDENAAAAKPKGKKVVKKVSGSAPAPPPPPPFGELRVRAGRPAATCMHACI